MSEMVFKISEVLTGLFVGAMLLIAVSLVPYWRNLGGVGFRAWFVAHSSHLGKLMVPLGVAATAAALISLGLALLQRDRLGPAGAQLAALFGVLVIYFAANKPINDRLFADPALSDQGVSALLRRWAAWHWLRVVLGLAAFVAAS